MDALLGRSGSAYTRAAAENRGALLAYLPVGYPSVPGSIAAMRAVVEAGADGVEIGLPYSDPVMDGVAIQRAGTAALERGVRTRDVFAAVEAVAALGVPAMVMTYWNLVERYGVDLFARDLDAAGGAGLITPDLTPDEGSAWIAAADAYGLDRTFLVSPSSTDDRIRMTAETCRGWIYATSVMGVTGTRTDAPSAAPDLVARVRALAPGRPVGVGLGVSNGDQAAAVCSYADGIFVGSAFVKALLAAEEAGTPDDLSQLQIIAADIADGVRRR
jgi:tryptophan synthase alpha chain